MERLTSNLEVFFTISYKQQKLNKGLLKKTA